MGVDLGVFEQTALVLAVCVAAGVLAMLLRQPILLGLIAAGVVIGPAVGGLIESAGEIEFLATVGLSLLLFVVGLRLDLRLLRRLGTVAFATGLGQIVFTAVLGFLLAVGLGFGVVPALYLAVALTFSSTIVVVKLLSDRGELDDLHGRVAIGLLIVQDIVVVAVLVLVTASGEVAGAPPGEALEAGALVLLRGLALVVLAIVVGRFAAPRLVGLFDRHGELLVLTIVTWAFLLAAVASQLGIGEEVGAFIAGVSLAATPYRDVVAARLSTLRDVLIVFFFIDLGLQIDPTVVTDELVAIVTLSAFVLVGNPVVVMAIMGVLGYRRRASFRTGLTVAQISEFSLVLVALGVQEGHVDDRVLSMVVMIGLVTITASTSLLSRSEELFERLSGPLAVFERATARPSLRDGDHPTRPEYVVIGAGRLGSTLISELLDAGDTVLGVDVDARGVTRDRPHLPVVYGDADDPGLADLLPLEQARWVISTLRDVPINRHLIGALRAGGYRGGIAVVAEDPDECDQLQTAGADVTIRPLQLAVTPLVRAILRETAGEPGAAPTEPARGEAGGQGT